MPTRALRTLQWIGIACVAVSAALPAFGWQIGTPGLPLALQPGPREVVLIGPPSEARTPVAEIAGGFTEWVGGGDAEDTLWSRRPIYAYALLPFWIAAILLARSRRRLAGTLVWLVTTAVIVLEAAYLKSDYLPFFPQLLGNLETGIAWCVVVGLLVWRRPADRTLGAVEAGIGAQALLAFVHGLTLPATLFRDWYAESGSNTALSNALAEFRPGYWVGMAGFILIAAGGYLGRRVDAPSDG